VEHDEVDMEVTNNTLLNMVHIEELGDSVVEPTPLKQSTSQRKFPSRFDDYVLCIDCLKSTPLNFQETNVE
jgi:hypothetical protein